MFWLIKICVVIVFYLTFSLNLIGQGQSPASIKWYQKNSDRFKVIFPLELDSVANYTLNFLENIYDTSAYDFGIKVR